MDLKAFRCGANVLAYKKNDQLFGMTCAWAMMSGYTQVMMLIGSQSETGNNIDLGDIVGISALACGQEKIARIIGTTHSSKTNKFKDIKYHLDDNALLIDGAKVIMVAKVIKIDDIDGDHLITFDIIRFKEDSKEDYLDGYNPKCYKE